MTLLDDLQKQLEEISTRIGLQENVISQTQSRLAQQRGNPNIRNLLNRQTSFLRELESQRNEIIKSIGEIQTEVDVAMAPSQRSQSSSILIPAILIGAVILG